MNKERFKIHIIGAGVSGLIAAKVLEDNGFQPTIIEATDRVGGRVKTDIVEGYQLDHGFQVLLTAYPAAQKFLNFKALELQEFLPGATIFNKGRIRTMGDPIRNLSLGLPTLFSGIANFSDMFKILRLNSILKKTSLTEIFKRPEISTLDYLMNIGFSEKIIDQFFKPFFTGIFLETELQTSSRMFEFVYKMFGEGYATLPKSGIEAIPKQLKSNLNTSTFLFDTKVQSVSENNVELESGKGIYSDVTIIAAEFNGLVQDSKKKKKKWKSCDTLYFEVSDRIIDSAIIGLISSENSLVNNIFYHTSQNTSTSGNKELLSVTVVRQHKLSAEELVKRVKDELKENCNIHDLIFLRHYHIPKALPALEELKNEIVSRDLKLGKGIFISGDTVLNGSLHAAMVAGEQVAKAVVQEFLQLQEV